MAGKGTRCRWRSAADLAVGRLPVTLLLLYRAAGQSLTGIVANDPEEAVYLVSFTDDHGAKSRAIVAMSSSRSTCPPGSSQDAPRSRGMSSSTPWPTRPSLRASMPWTAAFREVIPLAVVQAALERDVAQRVDVAVGIAEAYPLGAAAPLPRGTHTAPDAPRPCMKHQAIPLSPP